MTFCNRGQMREKVERLEHHPDLATDGGDVANVIGELDAVDEDVSALVFLEPIDRPDERRLAGAGGTEDHDHFAALDGQVDAAQYMELAEPFVDVAADDDVVGFAGSGLIPNGHRVPTPICSSSR